MFYSIQITGNQSQINYPCQLYNFKSVLSIFICESQKNQYKL